MCLKNITWRDIQSTTRCQWPKSLSCWDVLPSRVVMRYPHRHEQDTTGRPHDATRWGDKKKGWKSRQKVCHEA